MTSTNNIIKVLSDNQSTFKFTPNPVTSHVELDGYCISPPDAVLPRSVDDNGGVYGPIASSIREHSSSPEDDITALSVYHFDDPTYVLVLLIAKDSSDNSKCKDSWRTAVSLKKKMLTNDKFTDTTYGEFARIGNVQGPTLKVTGRFLHVGLGQASSAVFTLANTTEYPFIPSAHVEAAGFLIEAPSVVGANASGSGGRWGAVNGKGTTGILIPPVIQALTIYRWEEDPESVLITVVARTAGGDSIVKVTIRPEIGPVPVPELVTSILGDDGVIGKVVRNNLAVAGSVISRLTEKGGVILNPALLEVEYEISLGLDG